MFQRTQTLFLFLALAAIAGSIVFPVLSGTIGASAFEYDSYGLFLLSEKGVAKIGDSYAYLVGAAAMLMLLFALSQYKRRTLQIRVCRIAYLLMLVQFALFFFTFNVDQKEGETSHYGIAFFLPLVGLVFTFLAEKFIQRDEKLVRSADRLR
jgi:hypothetical protein